jgi:hypothetical protein
MDKIQMTDLVVYRSIVPDISKLVFGSAKSARSANV